MSKISARRRPVRNEDGSACDYDIGYGKPPAQHRFKPGLSGNPKGRPKGTPNVATIVRGLAAKKLKITEGGKTRNVSALEASITRLVGSALKGDHKSLVLFLSLVRPLESPATEMEQVDKEDQEAFDAFVHELEEDLKEKKARSR